jgi:hypothetical protein
VTKRLIDPLPSERYYETRRITVAFVHRASRVFPWLPYVSFATPRSRELRQFGQKSLASPQQAHRYPRLVDSEQDLLPGVLYRPLRAPRMNCSPSCPGACSPAMTAYIESFRGIAGQIDPKEKPRQGESDGDRDRCIYIGSEGERGGE